MIYYNASDVAANKKYLTPEMKDYITTDGCRRDFILTHFGGPKDTKDMCHGCCDNCDLKIDQNDHSEVAEVSVDVKEMHSRRSKDSQRVIQAVLEDYFDMENTVVPEAMLLPGAVTGLSKQLARSLARNALQYCSRIKLATDFGDIQPHYQENIVLILQSMT